MSEELHDYKIQINYKSGHQIVRWFEKFKVDTKQGDVVGYEYTLADGQERILYLGLSNIESIEQLSVRKRRG